MLSKIKRYYHTLKHLKLIQVRYQIWYRLRAKFYPINYLEEFNNVSHQKITLSSFPDQHSHYLSRNTFQFLNLTHEFGDKIDWNYSGNGKLWAYHLNYFDYLNQANISKENGFELIEEFLSDIANRNEGLDPYPTSLRLTNWIKFLSTHSEYPQSIVDSIFNQYQLLTQKLEYHLLGNHLLENAFSLVFGAVFLKNENLSRLSVEILSNELNEQYLEDGAHFELSPMYHLILLQKSLDCYNLLQNNEHLLDEVIPLLGEKIQLMVNWINTIKFDNGEIPMFNDSVTGQALDVNVILNYATQLGFKHDFVNLTHSGYRRRNWDNFELILDVGKIGPEYIPGHAHSDTLNFVLNYNNSPILVDRGISTYENNPVRWEERSTKSHNTVTVFDDEQSDVWGAFRVGRRAIASIIDVEDNSITAEHDGYKNKSIKHVRKWIYSDHIVTVEDFLHGKPQNAKAYFHFHPNISVELINKRQIRVETLNFHFEGSQDIALKNYGYCTGFNRTIPAQKIEVSFNDQLKTTISE